MKISLINMPFAPVGAPSIGLTQIESVVRWRFGVKVNVSIHYLNLDFAAKMKSSGFYEEAVSPRGRMTGLSDWFFRSAAFPEAEDNIDDYLSRYYFDDTASTEKLITFIRSRRQEMYDFLDELIVKYDLATSDLVGFSLSFFQTTASIAMANRLKAQNPGILVAFGGPEVKGIPGFTLAGSVPSVDYVFSGPALVSFPELISSVFSEDRNSLPGIQGLFIKGRESVLPPEKDVGPNLDINREIPLDYGPFLERFEECVDDSSVVPFLLLQTSRGCRWADRQRCTFCGLNCLNEHFEAMSPGCAIRHINSVLKYTDRVSYFVACDNMVPPGYFSGVFPEIRTKDGVYIKYETRPDITIEEMRVLCDAGVRCVQPGVEALSTESLKLMRKGVTAFNNIRFLKDCISCALFAEWNILLFSPGEREDVYRKYEQDIPNLVHLQPPVGVFPVEFVRDSRYFQYPDEYGLDLEPHESLSYIYPFDKKIISNLALRFYNRNTEIVKMDHWLEKLGVMVEKWKKRWSVPPDERPRLILWRDEHSAVIYDSRFGNGKSYRIPGVEEKLLMEIDNRPMSVEEIAGICNIDEQCAGGMIDLLKERNLLFEENEKYLSLAVLSKS